MADLSRYDHRSLASFAVSFCVHIALIVCFSLLFFRFSGNPTISLDMSSVNDSSDLLTLESPVFDALPKSELMQAAVYETPVQQPDLPLDELDESVGELDSFQLAPSLLADFELVNLEAGASSGFFGIEPNGDRIVYVIDMSVSMRHMSYHSRRYDRAVAEVMRSIEQLQPDQTFYVYLFCFQKLEMNIGQSRGEFCFPTTENKSKLRDWLASIQLGAGTDPRETLVSALELDPSCVFLLSDGEFNGPRYRNGPYANRIRATRLAKEHNRTNCPIHTIGLEDKANQRDLTSIAEQSGGIYKFISAQPK